MSEPPGRVNTAGLRLEGRALLASAPVMAEAKRAKKKRTKRERKERRFSGGEMQASRVAVGVGVLGGLALGAGVYSQWVS